MSIFFAKHCKCLDQLTFLLHILNVSALLNCNFPGVVTHAVRKWHLKSTDQYNIIMMKIVLQGVGSGPFYKKLIY